MKFGVITLVSDNYGNKYQNYAVEQLLSQYGEVETFELEKLYRAPHKAQKSLLKKLSPKYIKEVLVSRPMYKYDINCTDKGVLYNYFYSKKNSKKLIGLKEKRSKNFDEFTKENLHISKKILNRNNTTKEWADKFDYFICGSDQIWNPSYATTSELAFCSFAPQKTICLSPSFGVSAISEHRKEEYETLLKDIYKLSVREEAGQKIIKDLTGKDAQVLLDPTMAISVEKWDALAKEPKTKLPEKYIACYFLGKIDKNYRRKINKIAKEKKLPIVMLFDITTPQYYTFDPAQVLYTIKNAEYVLTDSFHATVFSILFHKNFYVFDRNEGGLSMNSRLETLLKKFDIKNTQNITDNQWEKVENILSSEREKTKKYLEEAFLSVGENPQNPKRNPVVYSGYLKDDKKLIKSASGGVATALSEAVIKDGGCVFGVSYSDNFKSADYICCETIEEIDKLKGSKYVETKKDFSQITLKLQSGKPVLFFGLGCDVASVLKYCEKNQIDTDNLYTVDILCHGPMSVTVHQKYIEDLEKKYKSKVVYFTSRSKKEGWSSSSFIKVVFENGKVFEKPFDETDYGYVFKHYALPKCEKCHFKDKEHKGDMCIGDYWGLTPNNPEWNKNGVSIIVLQTQKGTRLLDFLEDDFVLQKTDAVFALENNPMYFKSRKSQCDYKQLSEELKDSTLHNTLKKKPEYKAWKRKIKDIKIKRTILKNIR